MRRGSQSPAVPLRWAGNDATLLVFVFALPEAHRHYVAQAKHRISTACHPTQRPHPWADCLGAVEPQLLAGASREQAHRLPQTHRGAGRRACRAGWRAAATADPAQESRAQTPAMCFRHRCFGRATAGDGRARSLAGAQMAGRGAARAAASTARLREATSVIAECAQMHPCQRRR